jgi:putative DNA primase/helicase
MNDVNDVLFQQLVDVFPTLPTNEKADILSSINSRPSGPAAACRMDDTGNAERFAAHHGGIVRYNHSAREWLISTFTHWRRDDDAAIQQLAKATARSLYDAAAVAANAGDDATAAALSKWARQSAAEGRRNAMLNLAKSEFPIAITRERLNQGDYLLNVQNGTLNLATDTLQPHNPDDLLTYVLPVHYDPAATCPTWDAFISRIMGDNADMVAYLARAVGYTLTGNTSAQCLFFLYGMGANGKSTFIETVAALMGELAHKARAQVLMQAERGGIPNEVAALAGKRLVVSSELSDGNRLNEGLVKDLTGGDTMSARFLYGEVFHFKPTFKLWLYGNHKPTIYGTDEGIWRRVRLIPFEVQIPSNERNPQLGRKLIDELPGILAWAVRGWQDYRKNGLQTPDKVQRATSDYRAESDILGTFLADRCILQGGATAEASKLYTAYGEWATENGLRPHSNVRLAKLLMERGFRREKNPTTRRQEYQGIGII